MTLLRRLEGMLGGAVPLPPLPRSPDSMGMPLAKRAFTVAEYHRMADVGILGEDDRVELLDGQIVEMTPIGPVHARCVTDVTRLFIQLLPETTVVRSQNPVVLDDYAEPEPDIAVARPTADRYGDEHPRPPDILLIVEVADTSLDYDRDVKGPAYARAGVPELWVVNLQDHRIEIYREPGPDGYASRYIARRGDAISPLAFPHIKVSAQEVLG